MGRFFIKQTTTGLMFDLVDADKTVIATSQVYASIVTCKRGIHSVKLAAPVAGIENHTKDGVTPCKNPKFEIYQDHSNSYRYRLRAKNGQIIAISLSYKTYEECEATVLSVKENVVNAKIEEV